MVDLSISMLIFLTLFLSVALGISWISWNFLVHFELVMY